MKEVASILFGAIFTVAVATALGSLILRPLRIQWYRGEAALFSWITGAGCLGFLTALLCCVHAARKGYFLWGGIAILVAAVCCHRGQARRRSLPAISFSWLVPFYLIVSAFFLYYLVNALAPEISPDGSGYHLGNVLRMWHHHGFDWDYPSMYAYLSQGTEMLFLFAFAFGRHSSAALVHFAFFCTLPLLLLCWGRRFGYPRAGLFAAILVFASPVMAKDGTSAYNDLAVATLIYAVFYLLQVWDETKDNKLLLIIGLLSGAAYAAKYTAALTLPFAFVWVCWKGGASRFRQLAALVLPAALIAAPWILRNWLWLGNPLAPFANAWFPNPYYHSGMERIYAESLRQYLDIKHNWQIPLQLTLRGGFVGGMFGPVFLLAPVALLALRFKYGRRLLAAALVFALPAYLNTGARFLIPALPFLSLAMGMALAELPGALVAIGLFHALVCWPPVLSTYCDPWNWRISQFPLRVALCKDPIDPFIVGTLGDVALKAAIEAAVPPTGKIFSFAGRPEAYIDRNIIVSYESTLGNLAHDILWAPQAHKPGYEQHFKFLPVTTRSVRVVNVASAPQADVMWTVAEMRIRYQGRELPRSPSWKVSASPNGWEAPLAFDNSYATRWSAWEALAPRERLGVEFPSPQAIDEVVLECDPTWKAILQVEILLPNGRWVPMTDTVDFVKADFPTGLRQAAARELKALGIQFLLINEGDMVYQDMKQFPNYWGIRQLAEKNGTHFYRID